MNEQTTDKKIEAILYLKGEAVAIEDLARILEVSDHEIQESLSVLESRLRQTSGLALIRDHNSVLLASAPELSQLIEQVMRYELQKDIGKAGRETLAIILYYHPIAKRDIDYIRGVNSATILRSLAIRGLIEKRVADNGVAVYYQPTVDLLAHLGVSNAKQLPEFEEHKTQIEKLFTVPE